MNAKELLEAANAVLAHVEWARNEYRANDDDDPDALKFLDQQERLAKAVLCEFETGTDAAIYPGCRVILKCDDDPNVSHHSGKLATVAAVEKHRKYPVVVQIPRFGYYGFRRDQVICLDDSTRR